MSKTQAIIWVNAEMQDASSPVFKIADRGAALGDGLFETIKISGGKPCHFAAHWSRLEASAKALHLPLVFACAAIRQAMCALAEANAITSGAARLTVSRGGGARGLALPIKPRPLVVITMTPDLPVFEQPLVVGLSSIRRNPWSISCCHKTLSYVDNIAARLQQENSIMRHEVVMLDVHGHVASASAANLFWWDGECLHTPSLACAVLPGTTRARVMQQAGKLDIAVKEGCYAPEALLSAKAAFLTNALIGVHVLDGLDFGKHRQARFALDSAPVMALRAALMGQ